MERGNRNNSSPVGKTHSGDLTVWSYITILALIINGDGGSSGESLISNGEATKTLDQWLKGGSGFDFGDPIVESNDTGGRGFDCVRLGVIPGGLKSEAEETGGLRSITVGIDTIPGCLKSEEEMSRGGGHRDHP